MTACLRALCDDRVDPLLRQPARLRHGRGGTEDLGASVTNPPQEAVVGKPEVEADDLWADFLHQRAESFVERAARRFGHQRRRLDPKLAVKRAETFAPPGRSRRVMRRRAVAKEVQLKGAIGRVAD